MTQPSSPFCIDSVSLAPTGSGLLDGLRLGVKDVFDVAGHVTGFGSPDWQRSHPAAQQTAPVIDALLNAGAHMVGLTVTDELTYSLNGENWHYGTPPNPRAAGRIPGGSSSGSASAVAADQVDVALGTDCGGSVRLPASFCGIYGIRTSHARVTSEGLLPLAYGFDTVGWFASSADHLRRVGAVLLGDDVAPVAPQRLVIATDLLAQLGSAEQASLQPSIDRFKQQFSAVTELSIGNADPDELMRAFRILQGAQIWAEHGDWVRREKPQLGPGIAQRFENASKISAAEVAQAQLVRDAFCRHLDSILTPGTVLCLPSAPGIAPLLNTPAAEMGDFRSKAMRFLCFAGMSGTPQISIPVTDLNGCPLGLSLMMARGADQTLLDFVAATDVRDATVGRPEINRPEVLAEVRAAFFRYEKALVNNELAVLDDLFLDSDQTVRYGVGENLYGFEQIKAFRAARPSVGLMRDLHNTVITSYGDACATASTEFTRAGNNSIGRQTQTWIRTPNGWKVVAAHVSLMPAPK